MIDCKSWGFSVVLSLMLCVPANGLSKSHRSFFAKINPSYDSTKPLAAQDRSGWAKGADVMIGPYNDEWVVGFSPSGRRARWWFKAQTPLTMPLSILGSHVLLGFRDGTVAKVDIVSGASVWQVQLDSFGARKPVVTKTDVIVMTARQQVYALDFQTGKTKWVYDAGKPDQLSVDQNAAPLVNDQRVYVGTSSGEVHALDAGTGASLWKTSPDMVQGRFSDIVGELVLHGDHLLVSRYDGLAAALRLDSSLPQIVWKQKMNAIGTSTYRNGRVYYGCLNGDVHAIDAQTGKSIWKTNTGQAVTYLKATERGLVVTGSRGSIVYLSSSDGNARWYDDIGSPVSADPIVMKDEVYVLTGNKAIYGMKLEH